MQKEVWSCVMTTAIALCMGAQCAMADVDEHVDFADFVERNISSVTTQACADETEDTGAWEVRHLFLNISPYVSVGIHDVADVTFAPEIEFVWERVQPR